MLNALLLTLEGADVAGVTRACSSLQRQGFQPAPAFEFNHGVMHGWQHPAAQLSDQRHVRTSAGVATCVGAVWYRGRFGPAALAVLLDDLGTHGRVDEMALHGSFAAFLQAGQHSVLLNDILGLVRIYMSHDRRCYSTSWLATCAYAGNVDIDEDAAIEYVLLGASHSEATVAHGITTVPMAYAVDLARRELRARLPRNGWENTSVPTRFDDAVAKVGGHLRSRFGDIVAAFRGHTRAALSGGFDSRLIAAALAACGDPPDLFVYGGADSDDVRIARAVADAVGLPLKVVDKAERNQGVMPDLERLVRNGLFFDGLPTDGIFDAGADVATRLEQTADGALALNGGGGEIFRNFFHLRDRSYRAKDIVLAFYRGFDRKIFRRDDALAAYTDRLARSIDRCVGGDGSMPGRTLDRRQVELVYPLFRCHYWMGVNNSIAARHGYYVTPLVDLESIRLACALPMDWKNAGRFESHLVAMLHPALAEQPSSYGFRFSEGPNAAARRAEWIHCARPVFARPWINAMHRRLRGSGADPALINYCRRLLPGEWRLDHLLDLARLPDNNAFSRALGVEIAWRELLA